MQIDRSGVHGVWCPPGIDGAQHPGAVGLDDDDLETAASAKVDVLRGIVEAGVVPPHQPASEDSRRHELVEAVQRSRPEALDISSGEVPFGGSAGQVRPQQVGIRSVRHRRFDRPAEDRLRVVHQVGIERIGTRNEHHECGLPAATRPPGLLPHGGQRPGIARQDHRVETCDVDTQLEGIGGRDAQQLTSVERGLQFAALFREVATPVRGYPSGEPGSDQLQAAGCRQRRLFRCMPRSHERQHLRSLTHHVRQHPGRLGRRRSANGRALLTERIRHHTGLPEHELGTRARRTVICHSNHGQSDQPFRGEHRLGHRRGRTRQTRLLPLAPSPVASPVRGKMRNIACVTPPVLRIFS